MPIKWCFATKGQLQLGWTFPAMAGLVPAIRAFLAAARAGMTATQKPG
jgi:hypothetical protein